MDNASPQPMCPQQHLSMNMASCSEHNVCQCPSPPVPWAFPGTHADHDARPLSSCFVYANLGLITVDSRFLFVLRPMVLGRHYLSLVQSLDVTALDDHIYPRHYVLEFYSPHDKTLLLLPRLSIHHTVCTVQRWWRRLKHRPRHIALMMAAHDRLGQWSQLHELDDECMRLICSFS